MESSYRVVGIDVHKSMLAVVVSDVAGEGEFQFERRKFGAPPRELRALVAWLKERDVREAIMESTAQYWKPVWHELEGQCELFLAQAQSNRAPRGRKGDFADAERLLRPHVAGELILSFVPNPEQRLWRMMTRSRHQLTRDRVRIHSQIESLLEDARIKLSSLVSDLLGVGSRRMLKALAGGETGCDETGEDGGSRLARHSGTVARRAQRRSHAQRFVSADSRVIFVSAGTD